VAETVVSQDRPSRGENSPTETMTAGVKFRVARFDDYSQITALEASGELGSRSREEWEHLWINNPVYQRLNNWPIGWVAENGAGEIVGSVGNVPVSYFLNGREMIAGTIRSVVVDPRYRGQGHAATLTNAFMQQEGADCVVISSANNYSFRLFEKVGFSRVPTGEWDRTQFWITNYHGFLASALESKGWPRVLSYPTAGVLSLRDRLTRVRPWVQENRYEVSYSTEFDERFEVFWEELKHTYPGRLQATRSLQVLQWHFRYPLQQQRMWILTAGSDSRIIAYAIFLRHDNERLNLKRVRLVDFQVLNEEDTRLAVPMLSWASLRCHDEGVHMLEAYGFAGEKRWVIDKVAPYDRCLHLWSSYYASRHAEVRQQLQDPGIWDPSHYEGDASL